MAQLRVTDDTRLYVKRLAAIGVTVNEMAFVIGCSEATIKRRFRMEIAAGKARLAISLRRRQIMAARKGSVPMLIWLGKQYLGQSDRQEIARGERVEVVEEIVYPMDGSEDASDSRAPDCPPHAAAS